MKRPFAELKMTEEQENMKYKGHIKFQVPIKHEEVGSVSLELRDQARSGDIDLTFKARYQTSSSKK